MAGCEIDKARRYGRPTIALQEAAKVVSAPGTGDLNFQCIDRPGRSDSLGRGARYLMFFRAVDEREVRFAYARDRRSRCAELLLTRVELAAARGGAPGYVERSARAHHRGSLLIPAPRHQSRLLRAAKRRRAEMSK